ncbi:ATP synthase F0 subunit C [Mycoplasma struthionis]|uniref:ATP synthase subunit c n=1 Tax=Mycoplasma struthionis TaxID=538220 RepID=A0A3G8LHY4_9MOLU|nr:ATP synthase F0 subunit C [Mycoplasma struthionis]TPI01967.1 ATP synthase F0 subunit C [Mycoplasma struthionis]
MDNLSNLAVNAYNSTKIGNGNQLAYGLTMLGAGLAIAGAGFVSVGQGIAVGKACEAVGRNPEALSKIRTLLILGLAIVETAAIYCFIISLLLFFV